ncbi:MBL fold metallo-hydrolase [Adhaeribacter aquaticus]|uniref:MBL fold metallo-hydrolase n=1 Tax=Adhaeribacter aquaticus TaxID=299567 RepID=UPI00047ABE4E|nr:MBL fold metallo-hydrolase [Adhaeribacter aquaticus]
MKQIAKDVFQIPLMPRDSINCYLIDDVLIDAGIKSSYTKILNAVKGRKLNAHVITHAHADHQGSSKVICEKLGIPFWSSGAEKRQAETGNATSEYPFQNHIVTRFQRKYWAGDGFAISRVLKEGDEVGGFKVIETPGHSSGHISFYRERDGVLVVGDVILNMNLLTTWVALHEPPALFTTDQSKNKESINKLASLKPKVLCFGHGPVLINNGELEKFVRKINNKERTQKGERL